MAYKPEVYIKSKNALDRRKSSAEREQQIKKATALLRCPEIAEIEKEMATCTAEVIKLIGYGKESEKQIKRISEMSLDAQRRRKQALVSAGFPENYLEIDYYCKNCNDTGYKDGYLCKCYKDLTIQTARESLCSVALLEQSSFEKFSLDYYSSDIDNSTQCVPREHMKTVYDICYEYAHNFKKNNRGLFFFGKTGLGKTHLSLAIADVVTKKGYNVYYSSVQSIMYKLDQEHFHNKNNDESILDDLLSCDLLVLDDLGAEFITSFTVSQLYNIINSRIISSLPTIISTNFDFEEVEKKYSQRVASRIIGSFQPIMFFGEDIRQIKAIQE